MPADHRDPRRRVFLAMGALYVAALCIVVIFGAVTFQRLYTDTPPRPISLEHEDVLIRTFDAQYRERYEDYKRFLGPSGGALAIYLGIWAAAFGVWRRKHWLGLAALAAGGVTTVLALSVLPWVYFPLDQYAVPAVWIFGNVMPIAIAWLLVTILGRTLTSTETGTHLIS